MWCLYLEVEQPTNRSLVNSMVDTIHSHVGALVIAVTHTLDHDILGNDGFDELAVFEINLMYKMFYIGTLESQNVN